MSYEDVCAIAGKGYKAGKGAGKKGPTGSGPWHRGKRTDEWMNGKREDGGKKGGKKGSKGSKPDGYGDKDEGGIGSKGKGKGKVRARAKTNTAMTVASKGISGVNCPYNGASSTDEEDDRTSSWESGPDEENAEKTREPGDT